MAGEHTVTIEGVDHIGIRVRELDRALTFYRMLGFELTQKVAHDAVAIIVNPAGVEINLIYNANAGDADSNILMDVPGKHPGYTHVALRVDSIAGTMAALKAHDIRITQGPVTFGGNKVSVFVRDPDRNVIELRGRGEDVAGASFYVNEQQDR